MRFVLFAVLAGLVFGGCSDSSLFVPTVWPDDARVALIATDEAGHVLVPTPTIVASDDAHEVTVDETVRFLYARTYARLDSDTGCRVATLGPEGVLAGEATAAWRGEVIDGRVRWEVETDPKPFELRLMGCAPVPSCDVVATLPRVMPTYAGLRAAAVTGDDELFVVGTGRAEDDRATLIARLRADELEVLPPIAGMVDVASNIDVGVGEIVGTTLGGWFFRLDPNGALVSTGSVGFAIRDADTGADGATAFVSDQGDVAILEAGAANAIALPSIDFDTDGNLMWPKVAMWSVDRIIVAGPDSRVRQFDGSTWRVIVDFPLIEIGAIAIDATRILVQPNKQPAMVLDEATAEWTLYEEIPFLIVNAISATAFGDGRFFIVGQSGYAAYLNGETACALGISIGANLDDLSVAPSRRVVFAVGNNAGPGTPPAVVRYSIPPP